MTQKKFSKKTKAGLILLVLLFSALAYVQIAACNQQKYINWVLNNFSMPSVYPHRSFPDVFYKMCPTDVAVNDEPREE